MVFATTTVKNNLRSNKENIEISAVFEIVCIKWQCDTLYNTDNAVSILLVGIRHGIQRNIEQIEAYISVNDDEVDSLRKATTKLEVDNRKWDLNY